MFFFKKPEIDPESKIPLKKKFKLFFATHYIGVLTFIIPLVFLGMMHPMPGQKHHWCAYTLSVMAAFWVFECLPLPITSFLPIIIFPMASIMTARATCAAYYNNTVMMFLGSIMLAASIEQSGLHIRIALYAIKCIGYSHMKVLFAVAFITMFLSMWITNTAAVTMMVPIVFALLKVYESQKLFKIYDVNPKTKEETATPITACYFCCITFAATNGGIGTLVGTATNLTFKGLFATTYKAAPEYISFPLYSGFAIPYMIVINLAMYMCLVLIYFGVGRPKSEAAKSVKIPPEGIKAAKEQVLKDIEKLGRLSCHEIMVLILFFGAMILFFARSPQVFPGWGDKIRDGFKIIFPKAYIKDATAAISIIWVMALLPSSNKFFKSFSAKYKDQLPQGPVTSVLNWTEMNLSLPYSFSFLLGGGFALSTGAKADYSDLNGKIGDGLATLSSLPNAAILLILIIFTIFITNFASNVAVCNVITPIAMQMAQKIGVNPLWYCVATGVAASFCYMIPVGTPGNLVVQSAAKIPTKQMIIAGAGPTILTIFFTWLFCYLFAPVIWPILHDSKPDWIPK